MGQKSAKLIVGKGADVWKLTSIASCNSAHNVFEEKRRRIAEGNNPDLL